ncbi:hypothetical protein WN873_07390, partial [Tetragenococcus halophilus]
HLIFLSFFRKKLKSEYSDYINAPLVIKNILNKHFEPEKNFGKRHIRYVNKGCQFPYWFENKSDYFEKLEQRKYWK